MSKTVCDICKKEKPDDVEPYNAVELLKGWNPGWYSGDDGEICGDDMLALYKKANRL